MAPALDFLSVADKATIGNMAPEYGANLRLLSPVDGRDHRLSEKPRAARPIAFKLVTALRQGTGSVPHREVGRSRIHGKRLTLDLADVVPSMAGPKRPEGRVALPAVCKRFCCGDDQRVQEGGGCLASLRRRKPQFSISAHGDVVIAAITSCTNTSNPSVLIGAGLLARQRRRQGPEGQNRGSRTLGWRRAARWSRNIFPTPDCNSISTRSASTWSASAAPPASAIPAPLPEEISKSINDNGIIGAAVLSGNPQL